MQRRETKRGKLWKQLMPHGEQQIYITQVPEGREGRGEMIFTDFEAKNI